MTARDGKERCPICDKALADSGVIHTDENGSRHAWCLIASQRSALDAGIEALERQIGAIEGDWFTSPTVAELSDALAKMRAARGGK